MDKERDLLPWILGGVLLTTVAAAMVAVAQSPPLNAEAPNTHSSTSLVAASAAFAPAVNTPAPPPASQIWECNIGGRRVFADSPCGAHAAIRELSPMNTMPASSPVTVYYPSPSPVYPAAGPGYRDEPEATDEQPDSQQLGAVYYYNGVARRRHPGRHGDHGHAPRGYHH